ncbi:MAG TPA: SDR family oxidoreductase [Vicinamibacterales bacterium]|nr:SDR family oxidoreductase [Vicinamibacterales bacterium]
MTRERGFVLGLAAGMAAVAMGRQAARSRRRIDFEGRTVVISGGSRGLGLVMARRLAAEGARVCLLARDQAELDRAQAELARIGRGEAMAVACDVRRRDEVRAAVSRVLERWHAVDVLINNAGVIQVGPLEHMSQEDFDNAMATHFAGPLFLMQEVLPSMRRRQFGRIVNVSSIGGRLAVPHLAPYCASKFALAGLSDAVRAELDRYGIRVTSVSPGLMRTGSPRNAQFKGQHEAEYAWFAISDSLPGLTTSAEQAARQILEACRYGDPELTITLVTKLAILANAIAPAWVAQATMLGARLLPGPAGPNGDQLKRGHESESRWAPSLATALSERAAMANNEV